MSDLDDFVPYAHFATQAVHAGQEPEQWAGRAIVPPISLSTTYKQEEPGKHAVCRLCIYYITDSGTVQCPLAKCKKNLQDWRTEVADLNIW